MKRLLSNLVKIVLGLIATLIGMGVLLVIAVYFLAIRPPDSSAYGSFANFPLGKWVSVMLSQLTGCSDGSDYHIDVRRGTSNNLIVFFAGGGACWDADTCSQPIEPNHFGYYFPYPWAIYPAFLGGIFQADNADNPFADWNAVYIPYCTADFDIGAATKTFTLDNGQTVTIDYRGRQNATEALNWVYANFAKPPKLLVAGESAGAFASILWVPTIAKHYTASAVYQLADGAFLQTPRWSQIVDQVWQANLQANFGFTVKDDLADDAYSFYAQNPLPNVTYMHLNTAYDGTLSYFNAKLNNVAYDPSYVESWSQLLRAGMKRVADSSLNYNYYLTDYGRSPTDGSTPHTSISGDLFYQITQDGVPLHDWLKRIVIDGAHLSVGSNLLNSS